MYNGQPYNATVEYKDKLLWEYANQCQCPMLLTSRYTGIPMGICKPIARFNDSKQQSICKACVRCKEQVASSQKRTTDSQRSPPNEADQFSNILWSALLTQFATNCSLKYFFPRRRSTCFRSSRHWPHLPSTAGGLALKN